MTTFIVGAKEPVIPDVAPDQIIAANGAASTFLNYVEDGVPLTALMTPYLLFPDIGPYASREELRLQTVKEMIKPEIQRLIIRPGLYTNCDEIVKSSVLEDISAKIVECWEFRDLDRLIIGVYGYKAILRELFHLRSFSLRKNKRLSVLSSFKISTGIMGLALAINDRNYTPPYYVIGIGDSDGNYSYTTTDKADRAAHLTADIKMLSELAKSKFGSEIIITDPGLNERFQKFRV
ncbi:MAG: hypothetical protein HOL70_19320 [Candidatus Marinimicrobia bacterium]|jgi:hypothetical protein|nr:hypothetical protein [Candidatus Neomarinimicrobiota bacterium]